MVLIDRIDLWAARDAERIALVHNGVKTSYGAFRVAISAAIAAVANAEPPRGTVAAIAIGNMFQAWLAALAVRAAGLHSIAIRDVGQIAALDIRDLSCIVTVQGEDRIAANAALPPGIRVIVLPGDVHRPAAMPADRAPDPARRMGGHILCTSGTTGSYKKVFVDPAFEAVRNECRAAELGITRDSVFNGVNFGLWTGAGYKQPSALWHVGGAVIFDQRPDFIDHVFDHGVNGASLLPGMYRRLLASPALPRGGAARTDLQLFASSGFLPLALAEGIVRDITPRLEILYSATELTRTPLRATFTGKDDLAWLAAADNGLAEVVREDGAPCAAGEEGFLRFGITELDASAYLDNDAASATVFRAGCFYPGDMAVRRADGRIRILGRVSDVINLRGNKVAVAPIEQSLQRMLDAEDVCLFAHLGESGREEILVAVQAAAHASRATLAAAAERFAGYDVRFSYFTHFPRNDTGTQKVRRATLRNMVIGRTRQLGAS
ncbi:hypothetical protein ASE00_17525 [Sphingomonas sp. Root710]|uniref:class I adenylate-forming enzyme family protein n=1 Tax=Sphingomonas sp. Root710 TaxID=1736594 RepID=UPI0006F47C7C|nr:class I adenylate-forming enzyme family protein [Sphingomonas sp. Root710]KRB80817.1 hypothetical protein ASE00_17525 [Sphingomonas sp. Root710]